MAHALTPAPSDPNSTTVTVPDGGDARTAASVQVPVQALLNAIAWLRGVMGGTISQALSLLSTLTVTGQVSANGGLNVAGASNFNGNVTVSNGHDLTVAGRGAALKGFDGRLVAVADADTQNYDPAVADSFHVATASANYDHFITPTITGLAGRRMTVSCAALSHPVVVHFTSSPGSPWTIQGSTGTYDALDFVFLSDTAVKLVGSNKVP